MRLKRIRFFIAIFIGRIIYFIMKIFSLDATTFPGKISIKICPYFIKEMSKNFEKVILITGTNGKTTTNNLIFNILNKGGYKVLGNLQGANLKSGIAGAYIRNPGKYNFASFEVDEGTFPLILEDINPYIVVITNFFRDQLDRYGEIDITVNKIFKSLEGNKNIKLVLNADDPFVARFQELSHERYFYGVSIKISECDFLDTKESVYCPKCGQKLSYEYFNYAQLGKYFCSCGFKNPDYNFYVNFADSKDKLYFSICEKEKNFSSSFNYPGIYNLYNIIAGYAVGRIFNIPHKKILEEISNFSFYLGRFEKFIYKNKEKILILVKNPAGYNQVLDMVKHDNSEKCLLLILNDNIADGRDVSWIWDVDFEKIKEDKNIKMIYCSGKRAEDLLVRLKYAEIPLSKITLAKEIKKSINLSLSFPSKTFILPTYSALLKTRKILFRKAKNVS